VLRDAIGRDWQCGTTQVDFNLPERFGAFYIDKDGEKKQPVMVHRAICRLDGAVPRHPDRELCRPHAVVVRAAAGGGGDHHFRAADEYAEKVARHLRKAGLQVETDLRNEKINYKVREHSLAKVPVILVCGKREAEENSVNVRRLGSRDQSSMTLDEVTAALVDEATPPDVKRRNAED
jgi:threonyl-tRNA synthetase